MKGKAILGIGGALFRALALAGACIMAAPAVAGAGDAQVRIAIPAQDLGDALVLFAKQTQQQILYSPDLVRGRRSRAVSGDLLPMEAVRRLLEGSGLQVRATRSGILVIGAARVEMDGARKARPSPGATILLPPALPPGSDIIVTARRHEEMLEDVPQTVNVVTSGQFLNLAIHNFEDVQQIVAGLTLSSGSSGTSNSASMRGVTFETESSANATVEFYLNDSPVSTSFLFQPPFDIGQLEIVRGPQGTLRGRAAPSGAITLTTRKPDLHDAGGYLSLSGTIDERFNVQGAIGMPVIADVLALRIAGVVDDSDYDGVASINNRLSPRQRNWALRGTVQFSPDDSLSMTVMYQASDNNIRSFSQVAGTGSSGMVAQSSGYAMPAVLPAGFNGPALTPRDRRALSDGARITTELQDIVTAQADWRFSGQKLVYVGSYSQSRRRSALPGDDANLLPGYDFDLRTATASRYWAHELRLTSEERVAGMFKYVLGFFSSRRSNEALNERGPTFGTGAFGSPLGAPTPFAPVVARYGVGTAILRTRSDSEASLFGNVTAYIGARTEMSMGARYITARRDSMTRFVREAGGFRLAPQDDVLCAGQSASPHYLGYCDIAVEAGPLGATIVEARTQRPVLYNIQLAHRFSDALMIYANHGNSWRYGPAIIGFTNGGTGSDGGIGDPMLRDLAEADAETSHFYELGFRASLLDKRVKLSGTVYRQDFDGLIYRGLPSFYLVDNGFSVPTVSQFAFTSNADARVKGVELEMAVRVTPRWGFSAGFSYASGRINHDLIPCNDGNFDGVADAIVPTAAAFQTAGRRVALCRSQGSITRSPTWNLIVQSEYRVPLSPGADAYVRGLLDHHPRNANDNGVEALAGYRIVNLYMGVDSRAGWDVSLFAKNLFDAGSVVSRQSIPLQSEGGLGSYFGDSGYYSLRVTPRRQLGVNLRYSFGAQ